MHVERLTIENIRPMRRLGLNLSRETNRAGWHVLLGDNGAGKSTVVRALALSHGSIKRLRHSPGPVSLARDR